MPIFTINVTTPVVQFSNQLVNINPTNLEPVLKENCAEYNKMGVQTTRPPKKVVFPIFKYTLMKFCIYSISSLHWDISLSFCSFTYNGVRFDVFLFMFLYMMPQLVKMVSMETESYNHSIVRKGHKIKPKQPNGDYCIHKQPAIQLSAQPWHQGDFVLNPHPPNNDSVPQVLKQV